jgi:hypothetical protein
MRLFEFGDFLRRIYLRTRFGQLSPLRLLRVELKWDVAECDWLARSKCEWDTNRPSREREYNASLQTLRDALAVREFLFCTLPSAQSAIFRVYRQGLEGQFELVIAGTVRRGEQASRRIRSLAMKGKLCGLQFRMSESGLEALQAEDWQSKSVPKFLENAESQQTEEV